jgi:hypothetical protein
MFVLPSSFCSFVKVHKCLHVNKPLPVSCQNCNAVRCSMFILITKGSQVHPHFQMQFKVLIWYTWGKEEPNLETDFDDVIEFVMIFSRVSRHRRPASQAFHDRTQIGVRATLEASEELRLLLRSRRKPWPHLSAQHLRLFPRFRLRLSSRFRSRPIQSASANRH